ncbi:MAG TPA: class I SAM-dependent methyltransferase [Nitrosarchaeum sp.]
MKYDSKVHWEDVWTRKKSNEVSWYQKEPQTSLDLILSTNPSKDVHIIDVGGGDSVLVDKLLELDFKNITVLDISANALKKAKERLGQKADRINWIESDIMEFDSEERYDIWHDRALLHFLTSEKDILNYRELIKKHVKGGGHLIISCFSTKGPKMCSGLDTVQYSEESIKKIFSEEFEHIKSFEEEHMTPRQTSQIFIYNIFRKK